MTKAKKKSTLIGLYSALFSVSCCISTVVTAQEEDPEKVAQQIEAIQSELSQLQADIDKELAREDQALAQLAQSERELGEVRRQLRDLDVQAQALEQEFATLNAEHEALKLKVAQSQEKLAGQLRAAYQTGRQPALRALLEQSDPALLARQMHYFRIMSGARTELIAQGMADIAALQELERKVASNRVAIELNRASMRSQEQELISAKQSRDTALANLRQSIASKRDEAGRLSADEKKLSELLARLQDLFADIPGNLDQAATFQAAKGGLIWPVNGKIRLGPGQRKDDGTNLWGMHVSAGNQAEVRAIHHGRVVYADWLRGLGLLVIIDHGDDFMSLYGFNEALYKDVGDWISPGEVIAEAGVRSVQDEPGIYFELRQSGEPIDPRPWLAKR